MPKDITFSEPLSHLDMHVDYQEGPDKGLTVLAERIIDITDLCRPQATGIGQVLIKYGRDDRGILTELIHREDPGIDVGNMVRLYPEDETYAGLFTHPGFISRLMIYKCDPFTLADTIFGYMPPEQ